MQILFDEYGTQLRLEDDGRVVLNVLCGRVAEYSIEFALNATELQSYKLSGDAFVKALAADVRQNPKMFGSRGRFC